MKLVFYGPPGAGKGTQAKLISKDFGLVQLSTGEILRNEIANATKVGETLMTLMASGQLAPNDLVVSLVIREAERYGDIILDGFPRTIEQAHSIDEYFARTNDRLSPVINFTVPDEKIIERITGRFECRACGEGYNDTLKPLIGGACSCGGKEFNRRTDDNAKALAERLARYHEHQTVILEHYSDRVINIDGDRPIDDVYADIKAQLNAYLDRVEPSPT